ncbi:CAS1 appressorium specific protein [Beauveria brongniartii RCEF 3172]|uniref:CAS1 appressorium specific protein n=1 Tax=Beauveria brongniartii RCEF 3172 TaxID=1081107 RepID=A0A167CQL8_9HYPO|nr:CAS1 appressorium specific protein [Beauveria brongniartii RCEF 3172]
MAPVKSILAASMLVAAQLVSGHAVITNAVGDAGGSGMALGVVTSTPRDGTKRNPFQQDATRFRGASADTFGETVGQGANNLESGMSNIMAETGDALPQVTPGGKLTMTLHQVNSDGAGPYQCMINADGTGTTWENIQVSQNVEGNQRGRNRQGSASDHPLVADIPANQQCTGTAGGQTGVCLVRCQNPANAGPFGGVVPVQMAAAAAPAAGGVAATPAAGGVAATPAVGGVGATPATGAGAVPAAGAGAVPAAGANTPATGAGAGVSTPATGAAPATGAGAVPAAGAGAVPAAGVNTPATGAGRNGAGRNGAGRNGAGNAADDDDEEEEEETGNTRGNGRNRNNNRRAVAWNA